MSTANDNVRSLVPVERGEQGLEFQSLDAAYRFAQYVVSSGIAPSGDKAEAVVVKMQAGWELGITPMRAMQNIVVFNGRISMMEKLAIALVRSSGKIAKGSMIKVWFTGTETADGFGDDFTCHVSSRRVDEPEENETTFSVKDAKLARLWGKTQDRGLSPWVAYPKRMLAARAKQHHFQDHYSDVLLGFATAETVMDDENVATIPTPAGRQLVRGAQATPPLVGPVIGATPTEVVVDPLFADGDVSLEAHEAAAAPAVVEAPDGSVVEE